MITTRAAILRSAPGEFEVAELQLEGPRTNEITVKMHGAGLCHSDDHLATGDHPVPIYPMCVGHEGAGEVVEVGPETPGWSVGDHVVFSFVPMCGRCRWCAEGKGNICDLGATVFTGARFDDPTSYRMSLDGQPVGQMCGISTFSEYTTASIQSALKVPDDLPLDKICLLGCGVSTGWGSSVNAAELKPGQTVIIIGIGGVGISAVQGAVHAGASYIIAVDLLANKREAALKFGATHAFGSMEEATEFARSVTNGQGADAVVITVGVIGAQQVQDAVAAIRKAGTVVVTAAGPMTMTSVELPLLEITMYQKRIIGSLFGMASPYVTIPRLIAAYRRGELRLDEMVTARYKLDEVAQGFRDMKAGKNIRGIIAFD
jgi:NDMA-dependent alcohol dehydrogenase